MINNFASHSHFIHELPIDPVRLIRLNHGSLNRKPGYRIPLPKYHLTKILRYNNIK
jgi:hypothetical protein